MHWIIREYNKRTSKGYGARVPVEVCHKRAWGAWIVQVDSALYLLMEVMLRWWKRNINKSFFKYLNRNSSAWRLNLKRVSNICWDEENSIYAPEV